MRLLSAKSSTGTQPTAMRRKSAGVRPSRALRLVAHPALLAAVLMAAAAPGLAQIDEDQLGALNLITDAKRVAPETSVSPAVGVCKAMCSTETGT